jgi:hypothetical protein
LLKILIPGEISLRIGDSSGGHLIFPAPEIEDSAKFHANGHEACHAVRRAINTVIA